ncbi:MAG: hypothetical protein AB9882_13380 [Ignavibacteriaceae bacterium]
MAIILQNPNGKLRGKLGPIYARIVKGRNIFSILPAPVPRAEIPFSEKYSKWATTIKFVRGLIAHEALRALNEKLRGTYYSGYHALVSKNVTKSGTTAPTEYNLVAVEGFNHVVSNMNVTESAFTATVPALNSSIYLAQEETDVRFAGVIVYSDPVDPASSPFLVTPLDKSVASYNFAASYSLSISLDPVQLKAGTEYQRKTVYLTIITRDTNGKIYQNSLTNSAVL